MKQPVLKSIGCFIIDEKTLKNDLIGKCVDKRKRV